MFGGREFGKFELKRIKTGGEMALDQLKEQLVKHIDEAYAMEQNVRRMLDGMIETTEDPEIKNELRDHKLETERHAERIQQRLEAHSATPSMVREAGGIAGALLKSVLDLTRGEKAGRNARDGYATEHLEIASYQLLERIAQRAGDEETAEVARQNRNDEEAMARRLDAHWDKFAELSLKEEGLTV
jgi:ferritin-like metal-binding protein YciE